jgi:hypothetical protein
VIGFSISGGRTEFLDLLLRTKKLDDTLRSEILGMAREARAEAHRALITGGRSGRIYTVSEQTRQARGVDFATGVRKTKTTRFTGKRRRHQASAPGEAPAKLTGALAQALLAGVFKKNKFAAFVLVRSTAFYGGFLELGGARIAPRPFLLPLENKYQNLLVARIENRLRDLE